MTRIEMTRAFVEKVVREWLEVSVLTVDSDGDIPVRHGSAAYYIRVVDSDPPVVSIFSTVLDGVPSSAKLLRHLNDLNARIAQAKVFHSNNRVLMALHLLAETITAEELVQACTVVADLSDQFDDELKALFEGETAFPDDGTDDDAVEV
jgi:hypothetical protein